MKYRVDLWSGWAEADLTDMVQIGDQWVSRVIDVNFPSSEGQPALSMTIDASTGVPRCTRLAIAAVDGGREVRTTDIRAVQVQDWIEAIVPAFLHEATPGGFTINAKDEAKVAEEVKRLREVRRADRRSINDDLLRRVAETYKSDPARPANAVKRAFQVSPRTAFRYIQLARDEGHLPKKDK
ncbi:hypothetical protein [Nocardioides sp. Soil796]|uniref:hypothetical protein n=1 Tax=Nocardioides sp. Soil796 TaxID=1736412 RepID=UPI000A88495D|nr:hypothetical protein [Nocardioides sp. Soil796]